MFVKTYYLIEVSCFDKEMKKQVIYTAGEGNIHLDTENKLQIKKYGFETVNEASNSIRRLQKSDFKINNNFYAYSVISKEVEYDSREEYLKDRSA